MGETRLAADFFRGRYAAIAAAAYDAPEARFDDADAAFAVGALTFLGRLDDARACFEAWRLRARRRDPRTLAATRFFFGLAHARAGDFERARTFLVDGLRAHLRESDAWARAFVFQGLACQRYFTGRYQAAARHALRALGAAHAAEFPYAKMLANDLRGHALVQLGHARAGVGLLEQAKAQARKLGLDMNAFAIECSIATYSLKFAPDLANLGRLEALLARRAHDSYSRHALLTEHAAQLALRGRAGEARRALEQADDEALRGDARRARVSTLLAHLEVARWSGGAEACARILEQAAELVHEADLTYRAELLGFEAFVARSRDDGSRLDRALAELRTLARRHGLYRATAALEQFSDAPARARPFSEDRLTPLLGSVVRRDETALHRVLSVGLLGLVPELLGFVPGRRILVLSAENAIVLEDHGEVVVRANPPRWCPRLLRLLAAGDVAKETLVTGLWGLRAYRAERHDPLLRTTIHRLRAVLEPFANWVRVTPHGYGSAVPVVFVGSEEAEVGALELPGPEDEAAPELSYPSRPPPRPAETGRAEGLCALLEKHDDARLDALARSLGISRSTALRELRALVRAKKVIRLGYARATRYRLAPRPGAWLDEP